MAKINIKYFIASILQYKPLPIFGDAVFFGTVSTRSTYIVITYLLLNSLTQLALFASEDA